MFQWWLEMIYRRYLIEADVAYCWKVLKLESSWFDFGFEFGIWINLIPTKMFDQDFTWTSDRCEWVGGSTSSLDIFERSAKMSKDGYESLLVPVSGKLGLLLKEIMISNSWKKKHSSAVESSLCLIHSKYCWSSILRKWNICNTSFTKTSLTEALTRRPIFLKFSPFVHCDPEAIILFENSLF